LGRARHKDVGAPQFQIRGGHAHPKRPRDYSFKLNKKVRKLALRMALTTKYLQNKLTIIEEIKLDAPKTKQVVEIAKKWGFSEANPVLFIDGEQVNETFSRAAHILPYVHILPIQGLILLVMC
jgi:large subunit ribosomal protein L4